jgi:hypothetical protein
MNPTIVYVPKEEISPAFGYWSSNHTIKIRNDLPVAMKEFLLDHEMHHDSNTEIGEFWAKEELEANWSAALKHPWGAFLTILYSLAPYRIAFYIQRFKDGK